MARRKKNQQKKTVEEKRHEESDDESGEIDYGATADGFVSSDSEVEQQEKQPKEDGEDEDSDGSDAEEIEESEDDDSTGTPEIQTPSSANGEFCTFDLRNLLAINPHQVSNQHLYNSSASKLTDEESSRITLQGTTKVNESYLLEKATDGCSQIIAALWQLPIERSDAGPLAQLPSVDESQIPRALVSNITKTFAEKLSEASNNRLLGSTSAEERNEMGEVCQRTWNCTKGKEKPQGLGRC